MSRIVLVSVLLALVTAGCGSGGDTAAPRGGAGEGDGAASSAPQPSEDASAGFFVSADTAAINKAAAAAQKAGTKARAQAAIRRCGRAGGKGYQSWRTCWHGLLDPYQLSLNGLATELNTLATHDLPHACVTSLGKAADAFAGFATDIEGLAAGIDSDQRAKQEKAMREYTTVLDRLTAGYTKPFQDLTQVCYSPQDLASINASPKASPSG